MIGFETLNITSLILSTVILGYSAWMDLKTREVPDRVWIIYLPASSILLILRLISNPQIANIYAASILITAGISLLMFQIGLFGGADLKAMICLSLALPIHPIPNKTLVKPLNPIFPLTVLYNSYLLSLSVVVYVLSKNFEWRIVKGKELFKNMKEPPWKMLLALLTGYKTSYRKLKGKTHLYPMEEPSKSGEHINRRLKLLYKSETDRNELIRQLEESIDEGFEDQVWITPGIPLLTFIWISVLSTTFIGDLLQTLVFNALQNVMNIGESLR